MDFPLWYGLLLVVIGFIAGIINVLAGGGSNLTIPALMVLGMPADIANATNRLGVFMQTIVGVLGFKKRKVLPTDDLKGIFIPTIIGGMIGAIIAAFAPEAILKYLLLATMLSMALIILIRPSMILPPEGTQPKKLSETPKAWWLLLVAGIYGGFVQAGVGFVLLTVFTGSLHYSLKQANSLKLICAFIFTAVALLIFILNGQVAWLPGLVLACGTMVGANVGVRLAIKIDQKVLKWFLFLMTLVACIAALISK